MFTDIERAPRGEPRSPNKGFLVESLVTGATVVGQLAVVRCEARQTKQGKPFLSLLFSDRTGQVDGKDFDNAEKHQAMLEPGTIVKVKAKVDEYNGQVQLLLERARACEPGEYDPGDFVAASAYDIEAMFAALGRVVADIRDAWIRKLLEVVLCRHADEWRRAPAAVRIHHAFAGGLLEHVLSMCRAACALAGHYTRLNRDLLVAGCLLHDIGKMKELAMGVAITQSAAGKLVGHIGEGLLILEDCCREIEGFPEGTKLVLRHLIVSHHGQMEYGALKLPMTPEAITLSFLDDLDAKLEHAFRLIDSSGDAEFSAYERTMQREIYCVRPEEAVSREPGAGAPEAETDPRE